MAKANPIHDFFHVHRFSVVVVTSSAEKELGIVVGAVTGRGLELWRAMRTGSFIVNEFEGVEKIRVELVARDQRTKRVIEYKVGDLEHLPFGVGIELGGRCLGNLNAMDNSIALEGVIFRDISLLSITDDVHDPDAG